MLGTTIFLLHVLVLSFISDLISGSPSSLQISSSGGARTAYPSYIGEYELVGSGNGPIYKHLSEQAYLYKNGPHQWAVGETITVDDAKFVTYTEKEFYNPPKEGWQYNDRGIFISDPTLVLRFLDI